MALLVCPATLAQQSQMQTAAAGTQTAGADWRFSVPQDKISSTTLTTKNVCFKRHRFSVELQNLPFITLQGPAKFSVDAGTEHVVPVQINTTGLKPGDYEGTAVIKCADCRKEKGCTQDIQNLHVVMTVEASVPRTEPQPTATPETSTPPPIVTTGAPRRGCECDIELGDLKAEVKYFDHFEQLLGQTKTPYQKEDGTEVKDGWKTNPAMQIKLTLPKGTLTLKGDGKIIVDRVVSIVVSGVSGAVWRRPKDDKHKKSDWYGGPDSLTDRIYDGDCDGKHDIKEKAAEVVILNAGRGTTAVNVVITFTGCKKQFVYAVKAQKGSDQNGVNGKADVEKVKQ